MLAKKQSKIHGKGIFTDAFILKETPFYKIPLKKVYYKPELMYAYIGEGISVSDKKVLNWINHSCEPNARIDTKKLVLAAIRDILPGEEITVNYNDTEVVGSRVACNCRSENCRRYFIIRSQPPK